MGINTYLIIGTICIILIILIFIIINYLKHNDKYLSNKLLKKKTNYHNLIEISYSNSGNSNGNTDFLVIDLINNKMRTEYANFHNEPLNVCEYKLNKNIHNIVDKIKEYNLSAYKGLPIDINHIALDAPIKIITLVYNDKEIEYITIDFNMEIPKTARERLNDVLNDILKLKETSDLVKKYKEKR